jgi:hypothetical protein
LIHEVQRSPAADAVPTLTRQTRPRTRLSWPRRSRRTEGHVDRAVSNIAFTALYRYFRIQFQGPASSGRCVSRGASTVAPTLSGEVTSSANAASVSASDSLVNLASGDPRPHGSRRVTKKTHNDWTDWCYQGVRLRSGTTKSGFAIGVTSCPMGSTRSCTQPRRPTFRKRIWQSETHNFVGSRKWSLRVVHHNTWLREDWWSTTTLEAHDRPASVRSHQCRAD